MTLRRLGRLVLAAQARCQTETREPGIAGHCIDQNIGRPDVPVNKSPCMEAAEGFHDADGGTEKLLHIQRTSDQAI